jgi:capsular polysaccharide transport system permease protein
MASDDAEVDIDDDHASEVRSVTALEKVRLVSQALSDAARRTRMSSRGRRGFSGGGFQARRGARIMRWAVIASFFVMVVAPSVAGAIYYALVASDQFVAEAEFTVSGGEAPPIDGIGALTGMPAMAILQDTQIVTNYIHSRAGLEALEKLVPVREAYASAAVDSLSRFNSKKPIEKFVRYWEKMSEVSIKMPAGIVELKIRAFTSEESERIARAVLQICEALINDLNDRMNHDAIANAQQELEQTAQRLTKARAALEEARNDTGLLDTGKAAEGLNRLAMETRASLLRFQQEYRTQLDNVSQSAPQMLALKSRIDVTQSQIAEIESKLTATQSSVGDQPTIAVSMTKFGELDLERQVAEHLYAGAETSLEAARLNAERKTMYLKTFVNPVAPQEAAYPRRALYSFLILVGSMAFWGILCGLAATIRNYMA